MKVTNELVDKLAHLARLEFSDAEKETYKADLQNMISFVEKLNELDTTHIEPLMHMGDALNNLRKDVIQGSISREEALLNAPSVHNNQFFSVPKVIKKEN
ncbi:MAG: Asp-tRNA(Asn)/Glu-tRNA(Gln) amidotransferase subunit GatC [Chitinophagaceae bacterium]